MTVARGINGVPAEAAVGQGWINEVEVLKPLPVCASYVSAVRRKWVARGEHVKFMPRSVPTGDEK
jgi:hypothetical protein